VRCKALKSLCKAYTRYEHRARTAAISSSLDQPSAGGTGGSTHAFSYTVTTPGKLSEESYKPGKVSISMEEQKKVTECKSKVSTVNSFKHNYLSAVIHSKKITIQPSAVSLRSLTELPRRRNFSIAIALERSRRYTRCFSHTCCAIGTCMMQDY